MAVIALLGLVWEFRWLRRLFIRNWKWCCSNPIFTRITSIPHGPRALRLDNEHAAQIGLFDNETCISTIK